MYVLMAQGDKSGKRYMTARERRIQRKLKGNDSMSTQPVDITAEATQFKATDDGKVANASKRQAKTGADQQLAQVRRCMMPMHFLHERRLRALVPQPVHRRGKKGKSKKLKGKYADQDEDERRLRMELLGHKEPGQQHPQTKGKTDRLLRTMPCHH